MKWYKVGAKFTEQQEDGTFKRVKKMYLVQGESFTDTEMATYEKLKHVMRGGGEVVSMASVNVHKIIEGEADQFCEVKISFMQSDDSGKKEKKVTHTIFMRADSMEDAVSGLRKLIKKEYPQFDIESASMSDVQFAYPVNDGTTPVVYSKTTDEDETEESADEAEENDDFEFPTDLDKLNKEVLEEVGATLAPAPAVEKKSAKGSKVAEKKSEPKAVKGKKAADVSEDAYAMP